MDNDQMAKTLRIGVVAQLIIPKQLEVFITSIFRQQFRKLAFILGVENIGLIGSIEDKVGELACISAIEEGLKLELAPLTIPLNLDDSEITVMQKIYAILAKQSQTTVTDHHYSTTELTQLCDILFFVYDKNDLDESSKFETIRQGFLGHKAKCATSKNLSIEVNLPKEWTPDADGETYFEYVVRSPSQRALSSEIEIPDYLIKLWKKENLAKLH
jgi:hypothetical protein